MRTDGRWVLAPLLALLLSACSSGAATPTPASSSPAAPTAAGEGTATPSLAGTLAPPTPAVTPASVAPPTPVPTVAPTPSSSALPTPRPTATQRPATPPPAAGGQTVSVSISNFTFVPATITVRVGTRVTWTNRQAGIQHTVTADDGSFESGYLSTGSSFSHVFTKAGTYPYRCAIHPFMTGTVIVTG